MQSSLDCWRQTISIDGYLVALSDLTSPLEHQLMQPQTLFRQDYYMMSLDSSDRASIESEIRS